MVKADCFGQGLEPLATSGEEFAAVKNAELGFWRLFFVGDYKRVGFGERNGSFWIKQESTGNFQPNNFICKSSSNKEI